MREKIVVIDDEQMILDLTAMVLQHRGFEVYTATSAAEGLELIEREAPALVLLDYMMPQMNGLTALREIHRRFIDIYVIVFTGKGSEELAVEMMKAGAADYILKPFSNANLIERIEAVLRLRSIELHNKQLLAEREQLLGEIARWNTVLEQRVTEKTAELERAHHDLMLGEKLVTLGHISAGMVHEIRNPLNSISLFSQLLRNALGGDAELSSYIERILQDVERIDSILVRLLDAGNRPLCHLGPVAIDQVLADVLATFAEQAAAQGVEVVTDIAAGVPAIQSDADEIAQVFSNLIANALFEMSGGGRLGVSVAYDSSNLMVSISDTGKGIPAEDLGKIFDPFFTTKSKGTGFGLSVVLRIVKSHGGNIQVDSKPGVGSRFVVSLPVG